MATASPIDVCNMAMDYLRQPAISSINPPGPKLAEQLCARRYDDARQKQLRQGTVWNFAKDETTILRSGTPDSQRYSDSYTLPTNCVKLLEISGEPVIGELFKIDYDIQGREILCRTSGAASIPIVFLKDEKDVSLWHPDFKELVAIQLAVMIGYQLTGKQSRVDELSKMLSVELPAALSADGQERVPRRVQRSRILNRRRQLGAAQYGTPWIFLD